MPSYEEVEAAGQKPFVPPATSKLQAAPADMASALGLPEQEQEGKPPSEDLESKEDAEAEKVIKNNSARIQETAEELYRVEEKLALSDTSRIDRLVNSKDAQDRKLAEKILKRNAETFGANSVEGYKILQARNSSTDPTEQKIAVQDLEIQSLKQKQVDSDWSQWKKDNSVSDEVAAIADDVRATYPNMSNGDILATARGRMGLTQTSSQKKSASTAIGSSGAPEQDDAVYASSLAKRLGLKDPDTTLKFAKGYLRTLNS